MRIGGLCAALLTLALAATPLSAQDAGDVVYVTDVLRLGLYPTEQTSGRAPRQLRSGDKLTVLTRKGFVARVRTDDNATGWVKAGYLQNDPPARAQLNAVEAERDRLAARVTNLETEMSTRKASVDALEKKARETIDNAAAEKEELLELRKRNARLTRELAVYRLSVPVTWVTLIALVMLAAGFGAGAWWLDYRSRQRHGGFRVM